MFIPLKIPPKQCFIKSMYTLWMLKGCTLVLWLEQNILLNSGGSCSPYKPAVTLPTGAEGKQVLTQLQCKCAGTPRRFVLAETTLHADH
jgi:hypothetical protein